MDCSTLFYSTLYRPSLYPILSICSLVFLSACLPYKHKPVYFSHMFIRAPLFLSVPSCSPLCSQASLSVCLSGLTLCPICLAIPFRLALSNHLYSLLLSIYPFPSVGPSRSDSFYMSISIWPIHTLNAHPDDTPHQFKSTRISTSLFRSRSH